MVEVSSGEQVGIVGKSNYSEQARIRSDRFQKSHRDDIRDLRDAGHSPVVYAVKEIDKYGGETPTPVMKCAACGKHWRGWAVQRFVGLSHRRECKGQGAPTRTDPNRPVPPSPETKAPRLLQRLEWPYLVMALLFVVATGVAVAITVVSIREGRPDSYIKSIGAVVDVHTSSGEGGTEYETTISVVVAGNEPVVFRSGFGGKSVRVGDTVTVFYDTADPTRTLETDSDRRDGHFYGLGIAAVLGMLAALAFGRWRSYDDGG